ncbi:TerD family protein [Nocardia sp. CS682]|uniref:TerD family protein n=1 Tax=Nocardia sp. CS682 TaxID=1047172 RepID=UPI0014300449|nr:TerD family protein [Nocardia sp. CS682]
MIQLPTSRTAPATVSELGVCRTLRYVRLGLWWDPLPRRTRLGRRGIPADLDASVLLFADRQLIDAVYFGQLTSRDGAVRHHGDNLTGDGRGENESITVDLTRTRRRLTTAIFVVTSYHGHQLRTVRNALCHLTDGTTTLARLDLTDHGTHTGMVVAMLCRRADCWRLDAIGAPIAATHPVEAVPYLIEYLR